MFYKSPLPRGVLLRAAVVLMVFTTVFAGSFSLLPIDNTRVSAALPFAPPANDNFADAQPMLGVSGVVFGTTVSATKEPLEQDIVGVNGTGSVWYKWQAPFDGRFVFTTSGSDFNTLLGVYSGANLPGIQVVANDDDQELCPTFSSFPTLSRVSFDAVGGVMYHIAVDTRFGTGGNIKLRWGLSATITVRTTTVSFTPPSGASGTSLDGDMCIRFGGFVLSDVPTGGSYTVDIRHQPFDFFGPAKDNPSISPLTGDVTLLFFLQSPAFTLSGRVSNLPSNDMTGVTAMCVSLNGGLISQAADIAISGDLVLFECHGLPKNAQYRVTPRKLGFAFSPTDQTATLFGDTGFPNPFVATAVSPHTISGRVTLPNGTTGVSGVTVALTGSQTASTVTGINGDYSFTVPHGGDYTVTPSQSNFTFTPASRTFNNLTTDQPGDFTAAFVLQLILDDTGQVAALDSMLHTRDPFPVMNGANLLNQGLDRNTRVVIFVSNFQLGPSEPASSVVINLTDSSQSFNIPAEDVRQTSDPAFTQVIFKLPDTVAPGTCTLFVKAHNLTSNTGTIKIKS